MQIITILKFLSLVKKKKKKLKSLVITIKMKEFIKMFKFHKMLESFSLYGFPVNQGEFWAIYWLLLEIQGYNISENAITYGKVYLVYS